MEFLIEISPVLNIVLFSVTIILLVRIIIYNHYFSKYFSNKKFQTKITYEIDIQNKKESFKVFIHNNNVNDARVIAFGLHYNNKTIDYFPAFLEEKEISHHQKFIVPSRDFIQYKIETKDLYHIICDSSKKPYKISKIYTYVNDSLGLITKSRAKEVQIALQRLATQEQLQNQENLKKLKQQHQLEKRNHRKEQRTLRKNKQKEIWKGRALKIRSIFKRK